MTTVETFRKGNRIGVNRNGKPIGQAINLPKGRGWTTQAYRSDGLFEHYVGVFTNPDDAVAAIAKFGQTPSHSR